MCGRLWRQDKESLNMKMLIVYLDTSTIGGCFDDEFREESRALMELIRLGVYKGMISPVTTDELMRAPAHVRDFLKEFDDVQIVKLEETPADVALSRAYMEAKIVTPKYKEDASHIAYATVHGADVVASWNFRHIVNYQRIHAFNTVNEREGYPPMEIMSPKQLIYGREEVNL